MLTKEETHVILKSCNCDLSSINELGSLGSMTNRNVLFEANGQKFVLRRAGEGSSELVNRTNEYKTYCAIQRYNLSDKIVFIDPESGIKITEFIEGARTCDSNNIDDVTLCMNKLHALHDLKLHVPHKFDLFAMIDYYEYLRGHESMYDDYLEVKQRVETLKFYLPKTQDDFCLTHIDPNQDNFLITKSDVRLIDWEYAAMQDPHVDIAMFAIYAGYNEDQIKSLIEIYFGEKPSEKIMCQIYSYIAICGLLWSNWCEYKKKCGIDFGDYAKSQYEYARKFSRCMEWNM